MEEHTVSALERLKKAAAPFVKVAEAYDGERETGGVDGGVFPDNWTVLLVSAEINSLRSNRERLTVGHFRALRAALVTKDSPVVSLKYAKVGDLVEVFHLDYNRDRSISERWKETWLKAMVCVAENSYGAIEVEYPSKLRQVVELSGWRPVGGGNES